MFTTDMIWFGLYKAFGRRTPSRLCLDLFHSKCKQHPSFAAEIVTNCDFHAHFEQISFLSRQQIFMKLHMEDLKQYNKDFRSCKFICL